MQDENQQHSEADSDIVTTDDKMDGCKIIKAIACFEVDHSRISLRDAKSQCAIFLDNNEKPIARLDFNSRQNTSACLTKRRDARNSQLMTSLRFTLTENESAKKLNAF